MSLVRCITPNCTGMVLFGGEHKACGVCRLSGEPISADSVERLVKERDEERREEQPRAKHGQVRPEDDALQNERRRRRQLNRRVAQADRRAALTAVSAEHEITQHRHVVVPANCGAAEWAS